MSTCFFLGAGFSRAVTNGAAPLMKGFFTGLDSEKYPLLHGFIVQTMGALDEVNLQDVICDLDQFCDLPMRPERRRTVLGEVDPSILLREVGTFAIERLADLKWSRGHWAVNLLAEADADCTVITTNFDTLAEGILCRKVGATHCGPTATCFHCRMRHILLTCCSCSIADRDGSPWRGSLLKLHGSIAWQCCVAKNCGERGCIYPECNCKPSQARRCRNCRSPMMPAILQPSMLKRYSDYPGMFAMWEAAQLAIEEAEELFIFGFSFPSTDRLIRQVFRTSLSTKRLKRVFLIDLDPQAVRKNLEPLLPAGFKADFVYLPTKADYSEPDWVVRVA